MKLQEKIILRIGEGVHPSFAMEKAKAVIDQGRISKDKGVDVYCFHSHFQTSGVHVSCRHNGGNSHTFYIYRETEGGL